ncbi:unnamed protein product, partial [Ectocarpus sp. 4 AP-2014]
PHLPPAVRAEFIFFSRVQSPLSSSTRKSNFVHSRAFQIFIALYYQARSEKKTLRPRIEPVAWSLVSLRGSTGPPGRPARRHTDLLIHLLSSIFVESSLRFIIFFLKNIGNQKTEPPQIRDETPWALKTVFHTIDVIWVYV